MMSKTNKSSSSHRALKALFVKSMGTQCTMQNNIGGSRSILRACKDFKNIVGSGQLEDLIINPRGNSYVSDAMIS